MKVNLRKHVGTRRMIHITRRTPCDPTVDGYLLGLSETLALMHVFREFTPDGYCVLRVKDILQVRSNVRNNGGTTFSRLRSFWQA